MSLRGKSLENIFKDTIELFLNDVMTFGVFVKGIGDCDRAKIFNRATNLASLRKGIAIPVQRTSLNKENT